jgi:hypothetical protein
MYIYVYVRTYVRTYVCMDVYERRLEILFDGKVP